MGSSERQKEIKRRRHRRQKLRKLAVKLAKANVSEREMIAMKLRGLTPGADVLIENWELADADR